MKHRRADDRPRGGFPNSRFLNSNDEQMDSTLFGDAKLAGVAGIVLPQQIEINRGIAGRVSGRD
jgi:hypothetical protein